MPFNFRDEIIHFIDYEDLPPGTMYYPDFRDWPKFMSVKVPVAGSHHTTVRDRLVKEYGTPRVAVVESDLMNDNCFNQLYL